MSSLTDQDVEEILGGASPAGKASEQPAEADDAPQVTVSRASANAGLRELRLLVPLKVDGRLMRKVGMRLPTQGDIDDWGNGEILYLQIAVTDTGRGLSDDDMKVLFQRFSQASPKTYKQYGGSGLGLFISRELCELQGGQIGVSSGSGKTTFTFFVRAKRWIHDAPAPCSGMGPFRYI